MRSRPNGRHILLRRKRIGQQFGGALAKHRVTDVDKAGYIMSMFLSGPKPTFAGLGVKLAGQAYKGVKDNWDGIRGTV